MPARPGVRWRRTLLLVLIPVGLAFVAAVEHGNPAIGKAIKRKIVAALKDPLNLLDERSPGGRGPGVLLSIKGPHERVLSAARERQPLLPPAVDTPLVAAPPEAVASIPIAPPEFDTTPQNQAAGLPPLSPFFPDVPPVFPIPVGTPTPIIAVGTPPPIIPVGTPPNTPAPPETTPGTPPITITIPEPASWTMMILGLLAIGAVVRRRARK